MLNLPVVNLDEADVRAMVRLIGEVAALPGGHADKKRFVMEGLCKLVNADMWVWCLSCEQDPDKPQVCISFVKGGFTEEKFVKYLEALEHPGMIALASKFFLELKEKQTHLTRGRTQIASAEELANSTAMPAWQAADIGPTILSERPLSKTSSSTIGLFRRYGHPEFSPRESRIAHIVLTEIPWLHEQGWPEDHGVEVPKLSKRQRLTLNLLTLGQNQKQIATQMKLSTHTVQGYIKDVYRHFGVHSQAELMTRFYQGNGRDID